MMRRIATEGACLRVAMVAACPFPSPRGSQVLIREVAEALSARGHAVHLVTYPYGENLSPIRGISMHRVRVPAFLARVAGLGWRKALVDLYMAAALYRLVCREHIDIIHAHNYEGPLIAFLVRAITGVPVVYHSHNALGDELAYYFRPGWRQSLARRLGRLLDRQVPRRADFSIALTPALETFLRSQGVSSDRVATIPPGVAPANVGDGAAHTPATFAGRFVVMYAGNLDPYQDLEVLCDAFAAAQPAIATGLLVVVTHDPQWAERLGGRLAVLVRSGMAQVIVAPAFAAVRRLLTAADVLVSPRSSWSGFPIKVINYMAAGRAIVAAAGSAKGLVDGDTGLVFANRDVHGLAALLVRLFRDAPLRQRLGDHARAAVRGGHSWPRVAEEIETIYTRLCDRHAGPRPEMLPVMQGLMGVSRGRVRAASGDRRE